LFTLDVAKGSFLLILGRLEIYGGEASIAREAGDLSRCWRRL